MRLNFAKQANLILQEVAKAVQKSACWCRLLLTCGTEADEWDPNLASWNGVSLKDEESVEGQVRVHREGLRGNARTQLGRQTY